MPTSCSALSSLAAATLLFIPASSSGLTGEGRPETGWLLALGSKLSVWGSPAGSTNSSGLCPAGHNVLSFGDQAVAAAQIRHTCAGCRASALGSTQAALGMPEACLTCRGEALEGRRAVVLLLLVLIMPRDHGASGLPSLLGQCRWKAQSNGICDATSALNAGCVQLAWPAHCSVTEECLQRRCHRLDGPGLAVLLWQAAGHKQDLSNVFLQQVAAQPSMLQLLCSSQGVTRQV